MGGGVQLHSGAALLQDLGVDLNFAQAMRRIRSRAVDGSELLKLDLVKLLASRLQTGIALLKHSFVAAVQCRNTRFIDGIIKFCNTIQHS